MSRSFHRIYIEKLWENAYPRMEPEKQELSAREAAFLETLALHAERERKLEERIEQLEKKDS